MRQRAVKHREEIVESCRAWLAEQPAENRGKWRALFGEEKPLCLETCGAYENKAAGSEKLLCLEIGSGKGRFICNMAKAHPENLYLACEGGENIGVRILQKAAEEQISNLRLIGEYITRPQDYFEEGELDGIFINFCDPWPKARHAHRRLTHHLLLEQYKKVIRKGGFLAFKTDNDALFEFSLEEFALAGLVPLRLSRDLHGSEWAQDNIMTEYEEKFSSTGKSINYAYIVME